jgi:hypothetical protein
MHPAVSLGVGGVRGDDGICQVHRVQQLFNLGDLVCVDGNVVLGDDYLLLLQHRGEQLDLPVCHATQPFPVNGDRGQQMIQPPSICQGAQPAAARRSIDTSP